VCPKNEPQPSLWFVSAAASSATVAAATTTTAAAAATMAGVGRRRDEMTRKGRRKGIGVGERGAAR